LFSVHPSPPHPDLRSFPTRRSSDLVYLGDSVLANLHQLPGLVADLLRAFPYDFLYGNIAADTSIAKKYAPVGRHCHAWHVGQEIFDLAPTDPLKAFGLGYLSHLAADSVAHNFF